MTQKGKQWRYVITCNNAKDENGEPKKYYSDTIAGDPTIKGGSIVVDLTRKEDGKLYKRITINNSDYTLEENLLAQEAA